MNVAPLLSISRLSKRFPGVVALDGVDLEIHRGEIHALMGQNGAGKSTLIKLLTGVYAPDTGDMRLDGRALRPGSPADAKRLGVSAVYQEVNLVPTLSVAENVLLGRAPRGWLGVSWRRMRAAARAALAEVGVQIDVAEALGSFPVAIQQMVAIVRALQFDARLLVLDEPTSSLDARETQTLFRLLRELKTRGLGVLFVTHFLDQVYAIADRITVLRNGGLVGTFEAAGLAKNDLVAKMLGRESNGDLAARTARLPRAPQETLLRATGLGRRGALAPADIELRRGEVLGLAGLLGSGRSELVRLLFGADRATSGEIEIVPGARGPTLSPPKAAAKGWGTRFLRPRRAIDAGMGLCPEERKADGVFAEMSVVENIAIVVQRTLSRWKIVSRRTHREIAQRLVTALGIVTPDLDRPVKYLSGGNQQKVILARWLASRPRILLLDEPTRGIDVGAKAEIEGLIDRLAHEDGMAILFVSAELEELVRRCERVMVLRDRRVIGELVGDEISEDRIMGRISGA